MWVHLFIIWVVLNEWKLLLPSLHCLGNETAWNSNVPELSLMASHPLSVLKFKTTFMWFRAYLFEVLIIKRNLGGSRLSNSWPVVWGFLVSYKETKQPLIRIYHRCSWLKVSKHIKKNTPRLSRNFLLPLIGGFKCFHTDMKKELPTINQFSILAWVNTCNWLSSKTYVFQLLHYFHIPY